MKKLISITLITVLCFGNLTGLFAATDSLNANSVACHQVLSDKEAKLVMGGAGVSICLKAVRVHVVGGNGKGIDGADIKVVIDDAAGTSWNLGGTTSWGGNFVGLITGITTSKGKITITVTVNGSTQTQEIPFGGLDAVYREFRF